MNEPPRVALAGVGYAVPPGIRTNDDPIFDWLKAHQTAGQDLFQGYKERRVLAGDDGPSDLPRTVVDLMVTAANGSAQVSLLDQAASNAESQGNIGAAAGLLKAGGNALSGS